MMYVLELPIFSCKRLGEVKHIDESGSKNRELHLHFANRKPPESFNFGNAACNSSRNSSPEQSTSSNNNLLLPKPSFQQSIFLSISSWYDVLGTTT